MIEYNPPFRILMGPGPSDCDPRVLRAMSQSLVSHLDPVFIGVMNDVQAGLQHVFETDSDITLPISGTGTAGMEAAMVNMVEEGDRVVVCSAGFFADRMQQIAERAGAEVIRVEAPWGQAVTPGQLQEAVDTHRPAVVAYVHVETSTGVCQPLEAFAGILRDREDIVTIVDAVASLGGQRVEAQRHGLDFVYSGSQKCLSVPPGLAPITLSEKAIQKLAGRKTPVQSWYLDLTMLRSYWGTARRYHHTAPISLNYALRESLRMIEEEGLSQRFERHRLNHRALIAGLEALGLRMFANPEFRSWTVNTVWIPEGIDDLTVRQKLISRFGIEIVGGLGDLKGRIWRIGLMGSSSEQRNVLLFLGALDEVLAEEGYRGPRGTAVTAAAEVYSDIPELRDVSAPAGSDGSRDRRLRTYGT